MYNNDDDDFTVGGGTKLNKWNYSNPEGENYSNLAVGTVTKIVLRQARDFDTNQPKFYDDGNPATQFLITITGDDGTKKDWVVDNKKSAQGILAIAAALNLEPGAPVNIKTLYGKKIAVKTSGLQTVNKNGRNVRMRMWQVKIGDEGDQEILEGIFNELKATKPKAIQPAAPVEIEDDLLNEALNNAMNVAKKPAQPEDLYSIYADEGIPF